MRFSTQIRWVGFAGALLLASGQPVFAQATNPQQATFHCQYTASSGDTPHQGDVCTGPNDGVVCEANVQRLCGSLTACTIRSLGCVQDVAPAQPATTPRAGAPTRPAGYGLIDPLGNVTFQTIIGRFIRFALGLVGVILFAMFIYGGFLWTTAGGEAKQVQEARNVIRNAIIGIVIVALSYTLINLLFSVTGAALGR